MGRIFALSVLLSAQIALGKCNVCLPFLVEPTHTSCEQHKKVSLKEDIVFYIWICATASFWRQNVECKITSGRYHWLNRVDFVRCARV